MKKLLIITLTILLSIPALAQGDIYFTPKVEKEKVELTAGDHLIKSGQFQYYTAASAVGAAVVLSWSWPKIAESRQKADTDPHAKPDAIPYIAVSAAAMGAVLYFSIGSIQHKIKAGKKLNLQAQANAGGLSLTMTF